MTATAQTSAARRRAWLIVPLVAFLALAALFFFRLGVGDPNRIPSALIGREVPKTELPPVEGLLRDGKPVPGVSPALFQGKVTLVNVWASWCVPCHDEAPLLDALAKDTRFQIVGINYKDQPDNARRFIGRYGNPFVAVGADPNGRGRLWRAGNVCRRKGRQDRLQAGGADHRAESRCRAQAGCREGLECQLESAAARAVFHVKQFLTMHRGTAPEKPDFRVCSPCFRPCPAQQAIFRVK
jgi:cytochrome c biogenesis protein CcmG, thiol:disulfide interchange protein DsbE